MTPSGAHEECPFQVGVLDRPQKLRYQNRRMCKATLRSENGCVHSGVKGLGGGLLAPGRVMGLEHGCQEDRSGHVPMIYSRVAIGCAT